MSFQARQTVRKYHQGWVHVKQNKTYKHMFAQLRAGKEFRFYDNEAWAIGAGNNCQIRVDLRDLKEVGVQNDTRRNNQHPVYLIVLKFHHSDDLKLRVTSSEERDIWIRFIRAAGLNQPPQNTQHLLPGQIHELHDIIRHELERVLLPTSDSVNDPDSDYTPMDSIKNGEDHCPWYYPDVFSRDDAEKILMKSSNNGNMLVRSRQRQNESDEYDFAVSAASMNPRSFHHYRVKWCARSATYEVSLTDGPHPRLDSLEAVIAFFEKRSSGKYRRLSSWISPPDHTYDQQLFAGPVYQNVNGK